MRKKCEILKSLKDTNKYTYSELSKIIGCSKPFIWQIINGQRNLSYEMAIMLSVIFNMTPDTIFYSEWINDSKMQNKIADILKKKKELEKK